MLNFFAVVLALILWLICIVVFLPFLPIIALTTKGGIQAYMRLMTIPLESRFWKHASK